MPDVQVYDHNPLNAPPEKPLEPVQDAVKQVTAPGRERRLRSRLFQIYVLLSFLGFTALTILVSVVQTNAVDVFITRELQEDVPQWAGILLTGVSWFGFFYQSFTLTLLAVLILYILGLRLESVMILVAVSVTTGLNELIKVVIRRPRPDANLVTVFQNLNSYSFPSGHVMFYVAFFGFLAFLTFTLIKRGWLRITLTIPFTLLMILVGPSRIYLGEHWATDVIAAYLLGFLILFGMIYLYRWAKVRYSRHQPVAPGEEEGDPSTPEKTTS